MLCVLTSGWCDRHRTGLWLLGGHSGREVVEGLSRPNQLHQTRHHAGAHLLSYAYAALVLVQLEAEILGREDVAEGVAGQAELEPWRAGHLAVQEEPDVRQDLSGQRNELRLSYGKAVHLRWHLAILHQVPGQ